MIWPGEKGRKREAEREREREKSLLSSSLRSGLSLAALAETSHSPLFPIHYGRINVSPHDNTASNDSKQLRTIFSRGEFYFRDRDDNRDESRKNEILS